MTDREKLTALMQQFSSGSQQLFAELIGVPRSNVATWMHRGSITAGGREAILDAFPQVSREWLKGSPTRPSGTSGRISGTAGKSLSMLVEQPSTIHFSRHDCIPYFSESRASCGVIEQLDNPELVTEHIHMPGLQARAAIPAEGSSMEPTIHDGDICLVGDEVRLSDVSARRIYLIVTRDGHCMFKRVQDEGPKTDHILVISENPDYTPHVQAIPKTDLLHLYPLRCVVHNMD